MEPTISNFYSIDSSIVFFDQVKHYRAVLKFQDGTEDTKFIFEKIIIGKSSIEMAVKILNYLKELEP